jgi:hypothetical protein
VRYQQVDNEDSKPEIDDQQTYSLMETGLQTPTMIDHDQDKMVYKWDLMSTVGF